MNKIKYDVYPKNSDRDLFLFPNDDYTLLDKNGREFYKKYLTNSERIDYKSYVDKYLFIIHAECYNIAQKILIDFTNKNNFQKLKKDFESNKCKIIIYIKDGGNFDEFESSVIDKTIFNNKNLAIIDLSSTVRSRRSKFQFESINLYPCINPETATAWTDKSFLSKMFERTFRFKKQFYFTTFNNVIKEHRVKLYSFLLENNLLKKGLCSFWSKYSLDSAQKIISDNYPDFSYDVTPYSDDSFLNLNESSDDFVWNGVFNYSSYFNSYFDIITESEYQNEVNLMMFTEKTWRPILLHSPFICLAQNGHLQVLRDSGFKTFSPYINESYDDEINDDKRIQMALEEIKKLCNMSKKDIHKFYWSQRNILVHNFNNFYSHINNNSIKSFNLILNAWENLYEKN